MNNNFSTEEQAVADAFAKIGIGINSFTETSEGLDIDMTKLDGNDITTEVFEEAKEVSGPEYKQPSRDNILLKVTDFVMDNITQEDLVTWIDEQINAANAAGYTEGYQDAGDEDN